MMMRETPRALSEAAPVEMAPLPFVDSEHPGLASGVFYFAAICRTNTPAARTFSPIYG
jgi:hypothetical protein